VTATILARASDTPRDVALHGVIAMALTCSRCGVKQGMLAVLTMDLGANKYLCPPCEEAVRREETTKAAERAKLLRAAAAKVIVTTTPHVDGHRVVRYLGIESVEYVIGTGLFSEFASGLADTFGARSSTFEKKLQEAKQQTMTALKYRAAEKGANAVIGVDLDYASFESNRMGLILSGTLVEIAPYG